jgi:hypothetical protein
VTQLLSYWLMYPDNLLKLVVFLMVLTLQLL